MEEKEIEITFKDCKPHKALKVLHVSEVWNDAQFYYIKNNRGDVYTIPLLNIVFTFTRKEEVKK